jgi:hypothetical protein
MLKKQNKIQTYGAIKTNAFFQNDNAAHGHQLPSAIVVQQ